MAGKGNCTVIMKTRELREKAAVFFKENRVPEPPQDHIHYIKRQ